MGKIWKCPSCKTIRGFKYGYDERIILCICPVCLEQMEVVEDD